MKIKILYTFLAGMLIGNCIVGYGWYESSREKENMLEKIALLENLTQVYQTDISHYLEQLDILSEYESMEGEKTSLGFVKRGGSYLIENEYEMEVLGRVLAHGGEIEPGVPAAEASYRLQNDLHLPDWFMLGTDEHRFSGKFDGDEHCISGKFASKERGPACFMMLEEDAQVGNLLVENDMYAYADVSVRCKDAKETADLVEHFSQFSQCSASILVSDYDFDTAKLADTLRWSWNKHKDNGRFLQVKFLPEEDGGSVKPISMEPFVNLAGEEMGRYVQREVDKADSFLYFIRMERLEDLTCCTFVVKNQAWEQYYVLLEGSWEGREVPLQRFTVPWYEITSNNFGDYYIKREDINFDGKKDLLIHAGSNWGSGGGWGNYRGIIWNGTEFVYYPSFPVQLSYLEFPKKQMISHGRCGIFFEYVNVYEIVNGEYELTKKLEYETKSQGDEVLRYYEFDTLVHEHIIQNGYDEVRSLYPELDYWGY